MNTTTDVFDKTALLLAGLDQAAVDTLLERLPAAQAQRLRGMLAEQDEIDERAQQAVFAEFLRSSRGAAIAELSGIELDDGLAARFTAHSTSDEEAADERPFGFLQQTECEGLSTLLAAEHPQTVALVLSHLPPERAAGVLESLDARLQVDVIRRLVDLDRTDPAILREVERGLQSRILEQLDCRRMSGLAAVGNILRVAEAPVKREILAKLAQHDCALAERLCPQQFEFSDLERLDGEMLTTVLAAANEDILRLALAGADTELVERIFGRFSSAEARWLRRSIEELGPTRLSDIEEAQRQVAAVARRLALEGRLKFEDE